MTDNMNNDRFHIRHRGKILLVIAIVVLGLLAYNTAAASDNAIVGVWGAQFLSR